MPQFIFSYRSAKDYDAAADPDGLAAWGAFINEVIAPSVVDPGWPVFEPAAVLGARPAHPTRRRGRWGAARRPAPRAPGRADPVAALEGLERPDPGERQRRYQAAGP